MTLLLNCLLGDPSIAQEYSHQFLCNNDFSRIEKTPSLSNRLDWQVSRVLKKYTNDAIVSLSHSKGHSALLSTPYQNNIKVGIDIEYMRMRNFQALSAWICSSQEREYLHQNNWDIEIFYRLWCIKESLIKAAKLNFPTDMPNVGYFFKNQNISGLRVHQQTNWFGISHILEKKFILACVWQTQDVQLNWQFHGRLNIHSLTKPIYITNFNKINLDIIR